MTRFQSLPLNKFDKLFYWILKMNGSNMCAIVFLLTNFMSGEWVTL